MEQYGTHFSFDTVLDKGAATIQPCICKIGAFNLRYIHVNLESQNCVFCQKSFEEGNTVKLYQTRCDKQVKKEMIELKRKKEKESIKNVYTK